MIHISILLTYIKEETCAVGIKGEGGIIALLLYIANGMLKGHYPIV